MSKFVLSVLVLLSILTCPARAQDVVYSHTFDGLANDSSPALQAYDNNAGSPSVNLVTGLISNGGSSAGGFNTTAPIDLSGETVFTVEFIVESNAASMNAAGLHGSFFGITSSATSNATDGSALYNNAGSSAGPAIGLQVGPGRGAAGADYVFDSVNGNGSFTDLSNSFTDAADEGYSVFVTYSDKGDGTTDVTITTTGLLFEVNTTINEAIAYSSFSSAVTPNVSSQGGVIDLASCKISVPVVLRGDVNLDGVVDFIDIPAFITILLNGMFQAEADCDDNGVVDFLDIPRFIEILLGPSTITVDSIAELQQYAVQDDVEVTMTPGIYTITGANVLAGLRQESDVNGTFRYNVVQFSGNNSTYDLTGVVLQVDSSVWTTEYGNGGVYHVQTLGNNNVIKNLTMVDVGTVNDAPRDDCVNIVMDGSNNRIEGFHVSSQGSSPYGYGDVFGKGGGSVLSLSKHSTCLVRGESNHVKDCTFIHRTFGHCVFMQAASNPRIEGCYIEGEMRTTDDILAEEGTGTRADGVDFMTEWGYRLPPGYIVSTGEEGIRAYNAGTTVIDGIVYQRGTSNPTVLDCTIKHMRGGVTLGFATGTVFVVNCTAIGCEQGFAIGSGTAINCKADVSHGHAFKSTYDNDRWDLDIEIIPAVDPYYNGQKCIAFIGMDNSEINLTGGDPNLPSDYRIQIGGILDGVRFKNGSLANQSTHNGGGNAVMNDTPHPIVIASGSNNNAGASGGAVTDNGNGNSIVD